MLEIKEGKISGYTHNFKLVPGDVIKINGIPCEVLSETVVGSDTNVMLLGSYDSDGPAVSKH